MPIDLETFKRLREAKLWPKVWECDCGRRLIASKGQRTIVCYSCGREWHIREGFVFERDSNGTQTIYFG